MAQTSKVVYHIYSSAPSSGHNSVFTLYSIKPFDLKRNYPNNMCFCPYLHRTNSCVCFFLSKYTDRTYFLLSVWKHDIHKYFIQSTLVLIVLLSKNVYRFVCILCDFTYLFCICLDINDYLELS